MPDQTEAGSEGAAGNGSGAAAGDVDIDAGDVGVVGIGGRTIGDADPQGDLGVAVDAGVSAVLELREGVYGAAGTAEEAEGSVRVDVASAGRRSRSRHSGR